MNAEANLYNDAQFNRALWCAVIQQAITDAICNGSKPSTQKDRREARSWLLDPNRDFNDACHLAGLEPDAVRRRAAETIAKHDAAPVRIKKPRNPTTLELIYECNGVTKTLTEWSRECGIDRNTLYARMRKGWSIEDAIMTPVVRRGRRVASPDPRQGKNIQDHALTGMLSASRDTTNIEIP